MRRKALSGAVLWLGFVAAGSPLYAQPAPTDAAPPAGDQPAAQVPAAPNPAGDRPEVRGPGGPGGFPGFGGPGGGRGGFGGGFGGFGGGRGGLLGEAMRSEVQAELKLTEEQIAKAREISDAQRAQFDPTIFQRMQAAQTDEERQKLTAEMQANAEKLRKQAEEQFQAVVTPDQFMRLKQLSLQRQGPSALADEALAAEVKLSPEQVESLKKLVDESRQASMARGFRVSREERDQLRAELEAKLLAVLSDDQKKAWTDKLGAPAPVAPERDDRGPRGFGGFPGGGNPPPPPGGNVASAPGAGAPLPGTPATVVMPPAGVAPMTDAPPAAVVVNGEKKLTFNFRFAPWELVLKWFAEQAELTMDLTATPPGTFNYFDNGQYSVTEALDILNGYLLQKGYILVRRDKFLVSLNIDNGIPPNLVPQVTLEELEKRGKNELLSVVLPLEGTDADTAAADIKELVGPQGKVVPLKKTNRLFITDIGGNLRKIYGLLSASGSVAAGTKTFKSFELKHITALEADRLLRDLFGLPQRTASGTVVATPTFPGFQPGQSRDGRFWGDRGDRGDRDRGNDNQQQPQQGQPAWPLPNANQTQMQIAIDSRTGSLLVTAKAEDMTLVEQAIKSIDVEGAKGGGNGQPQLEVFPLQTADTRSVVEMLNTLIPGMRITEDTKARRVSVYAGPNELAQVREIVKQLDGSAGDNATVIPLRRLDPVAAAQSLKSLFGGGRSSEGPSIEADAQGRRIMVRGTSEQVSQVRALLTQMGEDGTSSGGSGGGGLRTISLGGRDPQQVLSLLQEMWPKDDSSPIRVVVPSAISPTMDGARREREGNGLGPVQRIVTPEPIVAPKETPVDSGGEDGSFDESLEEADEPTNTATPEPGNIGDELRALFGEGPAQPEKQEPPVEAAPDKESPLKESTDKPGKAVVDEELEAAKSGAVPAKSVAGAPIVVAPNGGNLIITSDDEEALDRVEKVISTLLAAAPARTKWTVFYLRTADATETATILGNLFPQGSVMKSDSGSGGMFGGLGSSLSSLGSSVGEMTGLNSLSKSGEALRIVAEPRSNALFVAGPADTVAQIEATLKILDANQLPESFRERVPRSIVVEYADVVKVSEVVKEVYKEQLEANPLAALGGAGGRGGINPLAMMMGGMAGGGNQKAPKVQMTLAVDERASTLIVSSSESLFKQVETMVKTIDLAAKEAKATVKVVPLTTTSGAVISQALGALVPKIKVTSSSAISNGGSSGSSRSSSSSGSSPSFTPPGGDAGGDPIRAMFEQRFRERMMEGGGFRGGFPGSDGGERRRRE